MIIEENKELCLDKLHNFFLFDQSKDFYLELADKPLEALVEKRTEIRHMSWENFLLFKSKIKDEIKELSTHTTELEKEIKRCIYLSK